MLLTKYRFSLLLVASTAGLSSCIYHLGAGLHTNDVTYLTRPVYTGDSVVHSASYLTGIANVGTAISLFDSEGSGNLSLMASFHRAHTWRHGTATYGAFIYGGALSLGGKPLSYYDSNNQEVAISAGNYAYQGLGLRGSYSFSCPIGSRFDWRILGTEASLSREFGALTRLRQRLPERALRSPYGHYADLVFFPDAYMFTTGLTTEFCFKNRRNEVSYNLRGFMGRTMGGYTQYYPEILLPVRNVAFAVQRSKTTYYILFTQLYYQFSCQIGYGVRLGQPKKKGPAF